MWPFGKKPKCPMCDELLGEDKVEVVIRIGSHPEDGEALEESAIVCEECADWLEMQSDPYHEIRETED